jgi:hypothetical protein
LRQAAERAEEAFGLVLLAVLVTYVLASVLSHRGWGAVIVGVSTSVTAIVAMTSSKASPTAVRRAVLAAAVALVLALIYAAFGGRHWLSASSFLEVGLLAAGMGWVLRRVTLSERVESKTILGALSVYASLGLLFTWIYSAIDRFEGGGFFGLAEEGGNDFIFFSYTTLTTTGYGNLIPSGEVGRMVAGLEMMAGQIFLVTLVAGLVSLWRPGQGFRLRRGNPPNERSTND